MRWSLSEREVAKFKEPGRYAVGDGAYLQISQWGTKAWVLRYVLDGKSHYMGLGPCTLVTLAEARSKARDGRRLLLDGVDPIAARRTARRKNLLSSSKVKTFKECAEAYVAAHEKSWRNRKSHTQWVSSLQQYVYPKIGQLSVADIDDGLVLEILEPIWTRIPETAGRVRGRIENILDWARVRKLREGGQSRTLAGAPRSCPAGAEQIAAREAPRGPAVRRGWRVHAGPSQSSRHIASRAGVHHPHRDTQG
jgi:Arm DNA-binding domain